MARDTAVLFFLTAFLLTAAGADGSASSAASRASTSVRCAPAASRDLRLQVFNEAGVPQQTLEEAEAEAGSIWARAGLRLRWTFPVGPIDLSNGQTVAVIVRRALTRSHPADRADLDPHAGSHPPLGRVLFGEDGRPGKIIEVSFGAVTSLVMRGSQQDKPVDQIPELGQLYLLGRGLGRVIAHEIGHWLMGRGHTEDGLMRATFGVRDLLEWKTVGLPREWTAPGSALEATLSARCELPPHADAREKPRTVVRREAFLDARAALQDAVDLIDQ